MIDAIFACPSIGIGSAQSSYENQQRAPVAMMQHADWSQHPKLWEWANAYKTPRQRKLDGAREYLKARAALHPEWAVRRQKAD